VPICYYIFMFKKPLFWEMLILLAVVGILNYVAHYYHLYWSVYEFDSIVHFLGGATLSAFFLWLYFFSGFFKPQDRSLKYFFIIAIIGTIFIGVSWEIFELFLGEDVLQKTEYPYDTMMDFIMDFLGAITIAFYAFIKEEKNKINNENESS